MLNKGVQVKRGQCSFRSVRPPRFTAQATATLAVFVLFCITAVHLLLCIKHGRCSAVLAAC